MNCDTTRPPTITRPSGRLDEPIALGFGADGSSRRSLGLVIVGGLIVSQFITLYVTPVIYLYLEVIQEKVLDRTSFFRSSKADAHKEVPWANRAPVAAGRGNGNGGMEHGN